jgi:hypothetical protein
MAVLIRFMFSGMSHNVNWYTVTDILKERTTFISGPHSQRRVLVSTGSNVKVRAIGVVKGQLGWQTNGTGMLCIRQGLGGLVGKFGHRLVIGCEVR